MQDPTDPFPWRSFTSWLREGIQAAFVMNKLMLLRSDRGFRVAATDEEARFLDKVSSYLPEYRDTIDAAMEGLKTSEPPDRETIERLWIGFHEYGLNSPACAEVVSKLGRSVFRSLSYTDQAIAAQGLLEGVWRSLGPAVAPEDLLNVDL